MGEKQKPEYDVVNRAAHLIKKPKDAKPKDVKRMAARIINDEINAPDPNKIAPKPKPGPKPPAPRKAARKR